METLHLNSYRSRSRIRARACVELVWRVQYSHKMHATVKLLCSDSWNLYSAPPHLEQVFRLLPTGMEGERGISRRIGIFSLPGLPGNQLLLQTGWRHGKLSRLNPVQRRTLRKGRHPRCQNVYKAYSPTYLSTLYFMPPSIHVQTILWWGNQTTSAGILWPQDICCCHWGTPGML